MRIFIGVHKREKKQIKKTSLCVPNSRLKQQDPKLLKRTPPNLLVCFFSKAVFKVLGCFRRAEHALLMTTGGLQMALYVRTMEI